MPQFKDYDIGVIVGRWQVADLHVGHLELISEVSTRHKRCIIFIGVSPTLGTKEHPLDYSARKAMIQEAFPDVMIAPILDTRRNDEWSKNLDASVRTIFPMGKVCLYGGRDSFLKQYSGQFEAREFPAADYRPATEIREEIGQEIASTVDFRKGVIYSTQNQYPKTYCTVDIAILQDRTVKNDCIEILLGKKLNEKKWRFPGGFLDQNETFEEACRREAEEETGVALEGNLDYICSQQINDWRYASTSDALTTSFFCGYYTFGTVQAGDDLAEVQWLKVESMREEDMVDSHRPLLRKLKEYLKKKEGK